MNLKMASSASIFIVLMLNACSHSSSSRQDDNVVSIGDYISRDGGREWHFSISEADVSKFPSWSPDKATPMTMDAVFRIAEKELPRYTHGVNGWSPQEISIEKIRHSQEFEDKWIFLVRFGRGNSEDYIRIPIAFSGVPVQGKERALDKNHWQ